MPTFKNMKELEKFLLKKISKGMVEVGRETQETVKKHIYSDVYGAGTPSTYERTYELVDSVAVEQWDASDGTIIDVSNNSDRIHANIDKYQHGSDRYNPNDYSEYVAETVHDGTSGKLFGEGYWTEPRPFMDNAREQISREKTHVKSLKNELIKQGLKVE